MSSFKGFISHLLSRFYYNILADSTRPVTGPVYHGDYRIPMWESGINPPLEALHKLYTFSPIAWPIFDFFLPPALVRVYHKFMRAFILLSALTLVLSCTSPESDKPFPAEQSFGFPGTDKTEIRNCPAGAVYIYKEYIIYTIQRQDSPGQDIYIFRPAARPAEPCSLDTGKAYFAIPAADMSGAGFFSGIYGPYLFIDRGTGPSHRMMAVLDISDKKFLLRKEGYSGASVEGGALTYFGKIDKADMPAEGIPCPQAEEWEKDGFGVIYERKYSFDLETGKRTPSDEFRCSPVQ